MRIIKNALPPAIFEKLQADVFKPGFAWYCYESPHYAEIRQPYGATYAHMAFVNGSAHSPIADDLVAYLRTILEANGEKLIGISKVIVECLNGALQNTTQLAHVDLTDDHQIGYLYLNDCDGDTIIYDKKYDKESDLDFYEQYLEVKDKLVETHYITPKANKFVTFDGLFYHADRTPTDNNRRIVVSYCYKAE